MLLHLDEPILTKKLLNITKLPFYSYNLEFELYLLRLQRQKTLITKLPPLKYHLNQQLTMNFFYTDYKSISKFTKIEGTHELMSG